MMLLNFVRKTAKAPANLDFDAMLDRAASAGYSPIIRSFKRDLAKNMGFDASGKQKSLFFGGLPGSLKATDIFFPAPNVVLFVKYYKPSDKAQNKAANDDPFKDPGKEEWENPKGDAPKLVVGQICQMDKDDGNHLENFLSTVFPNMSWKGMTDITPLKALSGKSASTPSEKDIEFAGIFRDKKLDKLFNSIREGVDSINLDEYLAASENPEGDEYFMDRMMEGDFFKEEILVVCRKTKQSIIRAKDRASLTALANAGIKCQCGGALEKEDVRRLLIVPEANKSLLNPSWTARIFLVNMLLKLGIHNNEIIVGEGMQGGQIVGAMLYDTPLLFFLADESFDPADVAATMPIIGDAVVYVISPEGKTTQDVEDALAGHGNVIALNGVDSINTALLANLEQVCEKSILKSLADINSSFTLDVSKLALMKVQQEA